MLGFGGCPLSSEQDVLLSGQQEVFGMMIPLPKRAGRGEAEPEALEDTPEGSEESCASTSV